MTAKIRHDWTQADAMSEAEVEAAAQADPDCKPLSDEALSRVKLSPRIKIIRRALKLTQEAFADRYGIPLGTLRDWEQAASEPDGAARSYLELIATDPVGVWKLRRRRGAPVAA